MHSLTRRGTAWLDAPVARLQSAAFIRRQRGVTMIEYVIMAAIAVALGVLLRSQLTSIFNTMLSKLKSAAS